MPYEPMRMDPEEEELRRKKTHQDEEHKRRHRSTSHTLLSVEVLVQNRRRDKGKVLVFGGLARVATCDEEVAQIESGRAEAEEGLTNYDFGG